jgi:hypothetical protein
MHQAAVSDIIIYIKYIFDSICKYINMSELSELTFILISCNQDYRRFLTFREIRSEKSDLRLPYKHIQYPSLVTTILKKPDSRQAPD